MALYFFIWLNLFIFHFVECKLSIDAQRLINNYCQRGEMWESFFFVCGFLWMGFQFFHSYLHYWIENKCASFFWHQINIESIFGIPWIYSLGIREKIDRKFHDPWHSHSSIKRFILNLTRFLSHCPFHVHHTNNNEIELAWEKKELRICKIVYMPITFVRIKSNISQAPIYYPCFDKSSR